MTKPQDNPELSTRPLTSGDWPHIARLFGANGACGGCWCMYWRVEKGGKTWEDVKGPKARRRLRDLVQSGRVTGVLAFAGSEPVGWCAVGPRPTFPRLDRSRVLQTGAGEETWSIACFFIPRRWRGMGVATRLLDAAVAFALERGASAVEGYPVKPQQAGRKVPAAFAWTGVPRIFEAAGFERLERPVGARPIYVKRPV